MAQQKWCVVADDQIVECWLDEATAQHRAHLLRRRRDEGRVQARSIRVTQPMRGSNFRMKPGRRFDGFTETASKWVLPSVLAALAGGATAAIVFKRGEAELRAELERSGRGISTTADAACRRAAEAQVWTTLGQYGLTPGACGRCSSSCSRARRRPRRRRPRRTPRRPQPEPAAARQPGQRRERRPRLRRHYAGSSDRLTPGSACAKMAGREKRRQPHGEDA